MNRRLKIIFSLLLLFLIVLPSIALAQTPVGKLTYVEGRVDVLRPPAPRAMPVKIGDPVFVGDIVRAKSNSKAEITFINDNIVRVAQNTRVEISEYMFEEARSSSVLKLSRGKVQAIVHEKIARRIATFGEANRFEIHTPTAIAGARGTNFVVSYQLNFTGVLVIDGVVYTYSPQFPDVVQTVTAGNISIIPENQPAQPPRPATDAEMKGYVISDTTGGPLPPGPPAPPENPPPPPPPPPPITETTDIIPPVISISGPPSLSNLSIATFNVSSDETVTFNYQMGSWAVISPNTTSDVFDITGLPDGSYTLVITATDLAGNVSTASYIWTIDRTGPVISFTSTPPSLTDLTSANFGLSSNETVTYSYSLDGNPVGSLNLTELIEGGHTFTVIATDLAGNVSTASYTWTIDLSGPTISFTSTPPSPTNSATANFGISSTDPTATLTYTLDGNPVSSPNLTGLTEGSHTFTVVATDALGNTSTPISYSWVTDYTAPTVTLSGGPPSPTDLNAANFNVSSSEDVTYLYTLDGNPVSSTSLSGLSEGTHTFTVIVADAAGNTSSASYTWTIMFPAPPADTTPPVVTITPEALPTAESLTDVTIDLSSNEPATYSYRIDEGAWTPIEPHFDILGLEEGHHTLEVQATDTAGNTSTTSLAFDLSRYSLTGNFYGCINDVSGEASGEVAGVWNQDWGGWIINMSGTGGSPNSTWTLYAGGTSCDTIESNDYGYWLLIANGSTCYESHTLSGTSNFRYLSLDRLGFGEGVLSGSYSEGDSYYYKLTDSGLGTYTETPLTFSGWWNYVTPYYLYYNDAGNIEIGGYQYGLIGGITSPWTGPADFLAMGKYWDYEGAAVDYLWNSLIWWSYNAIDGGAFGGYTGGIWKNGTMNGAAVALYIDPDGNAGYLTGGVSGYYYPQIEMWMAEGTLVPTQMTTGLDPEDFQTEWGSLGAHLAGNFDGTGSIEGWRGGYVYEETLFFVEDSESFPWGIYNLKLGEENTFENKPAGTTNWSAMIGGQGTFDYGGDSGYWLAEVNGTWSDDGEIRGDLLNGKYITPIQMGTIEGPFYGINNGVESGTWIGESLGTWSGTPLTFVSTVSCMLCHSGSSDGYFSGLMGGTESLWTAPASVTMMGEYHPDSNVPHIWGTQIYSYNYKNGTYTTYDDPGTSQSESGAYYGYIGGTEINNDMDGRLIALYIDPPDTGGVSRAGVLKGSLTGTAYPEIEMFEMEGVVYLEQRAPDIGIAPEGLYESIWFDEEQGGLSGSIGTDGWISGEGNLLLSTMSIVNWDSNTAQPWGIYSFTDYGDFSNPEGAITWTAKAGGGGAFGASYIHDDSLEGDWGYWLADITDGTAIENRLTGVVGGRFLTYTKLGTIEGELLGTYNDNTWQAVSLGTWSGDPLTFVSEVDAQLKYYDLERSDLVEDGNFYGLMGGGGVHSLWAANEADPAPVTMIGSYSPGENPYHIWNQEILSQNYIEDEHTTYDGGAYKGYIAGTEIEDALEGRLVALYIDPPDTEGVSRAGVLKGSLTGTAYPDINMFEMDGGIYPTQIVSDIGISPGDLYGNVNITLLDVYAGEKEFEFNDVSMDSEDYNIGGELMNISSQDWGIWSGDVAGYYDEILGEPGSWIWSIVAKNDSMIIGTQTIGTQWSDNKLLGSTTGYLADIRSDPFTAISVGETLGTFNPVDCTWQAVQMGVWIETNKFLEMADKVEGVPNIEALQKLNIPCVEVGRASLSGSGDHEGGSINVNMNNVIFFAPNTVARPSIWATNSVGGTYSGNPLGAEAPLSGKGLNAYFNVQQWDPAANGKWLLTITDGTGTELMLNGNPVTFDPALTFHGAAAGTHTGTTSGDISGTAAGVAR